MPFVGKLEYERVEGKESVFGRPVFRLTRQFSYVTTIKCVTAGIICDVGYETDFATIPGWVFFLRPRNGKWAKASVIHDKACNLASEGTLDYKTADMIFYRAMLDDEASWFTANFIYFSVRLNHLVVGKG